MDAFADLRYLYSISRGVPSAEPAFQKIAPWISPADVVVEVGAARGGGTLLLSSLARHVFVFEPNRYSYRVLRHFTKDRSNVSTFNVAVGAKQGIARLNMVAGEAAAYGCSIRRLEGLTYQGHLDARMVRLDDMKFPIAPSVLIIDCEGYEGEVLQGAGDLLHKVRMLFVETHVTSDGHNTLPDVLSRLEEVHMMTSVFSSEDELSWVSGTRPETRASPYPSTGSTCQ